MTYLGLFKLLGLSVIFNQYYCELFNMNMNVVYYFKVYAELLYTIHRYRTSKDCTR